MTCAMRSGKLIYMYHKIARLVYWHSGEQFLKLNEAIIQHLPLSFVIFGLECFVCRLHSSHGIYHSFCEGLILICYFNKLQTLVWGHTKIPGGECHRLGNRHTKLTSWNMCSSLNCLAGMLADVWASQCDPTVYAQGFATQRGKQMIVTSFWWCQSCLVYVEGREYIREVHMSSRLLSGFLGAKHSGNLPRSHWPSVAATSVPLMEWEYILTGKCFYLFNCMCARLSRVPFVSMTSIVCKLAR